MILKQTMDVKKNIKKATQFSLLGSLQWIFVLAIGSAPVYATETIGEILINGEPVPPIIFESHRRVEEYGAGPCFIPERKEKLIDLIVVAQQYNEVIGRTNTSGRSVIGELQHALSNLPDQSSQRQVSSKFTQARKDRGAYFKYVDFRTKRSDLHEEYQKRVRDKDPHITNLTIARVMEINKPDVREWDVALTEIATDIKNGMPFEKAATKYPQDQYESRHQEDHWVALHSLPLDIDKNTVKVGDIYGVENILSFNEFYKPIIKILELKILPQVRLSDKIFIDRRPIRDPSYLIRYLRDKATERKTHSIMSELWTQRTITEDGKPIQRVGVYNTCKSLFD